MVTHIPPPHFPPPQGDVRQMDEEVWALFNNFSDRPAGSSRLSPSSSSKSSSSRFPTSSSSSSSSSSRWSFRNRSPPPPPSGVSSSVRPTRPQPYSPGHAPLLQVPSVRSRVVHVQSMISPVTLVSVSSLWDVL